MAPLLNVEELGQILGRSPHTLKRDLRRNPGAVPPRMELPGTRLLRWRPEAVQKWLDEITLERAKAAKK
jgi:predicted DNA-binding transcriptional regulator AlpA